MMGVFNNLVMYDQHVPQSSLQSIVPDLATEWSWNEDRHRTDVQAAPGRQMARRQAVHRQGRQVHLGSAARQGAARSCGSTPARPWYRNLEEVTPNGDYEVTFDLKRPQPAFIALLASGFSPIYPCHVPPRDMRQHPIGTGPFKFVEFKPNEVHQGHPQPGLLEEGPAISRRHRIYDHQEPVDGQSWRSVAGKFDMTSPYFFQVPMLKDIAEARSRRRSASWCRATSIAT